MNEQHVTAWMDGYKRSWEEQDADAFVTLFTGDAVYRDTPFDEPFYGPGLHAVWTDLAKRQTDNRFEFEVLAVSDDMAFVHWWGQTTRVPSGQQRKGDGMFILYFHENGNCRELREWQHWVPVEGATGD